jgi:ABC-type methionine transport system ATPase subunit
VAIARALANEPRLLLADEPTGNLDSSSGVEVMDAFQRLNQEQGTTILVVTHDAAIARATRRVVMLRDGKVERDQAVGDPFRHDLQQFKASGLGQALLEGRVPQAVVGLGLEALLPQLQGVLATV